MKTLAALVHCRFPGITLPATVLVALLQRTPAVRIAAAVGEKFATSPAGQLLRGGVTLGSLGAIHSVAGATTYVQNPGNPIPGVVGTPLNAGFAFTGAPSDAQSWSVLSGQLPPGLTFVPAAIGGAIIARDVGITGTPTQGGNFSVTVRANGLAGQSDPVQIAFQISGGASATAPAITTQPQPQTVAVGGAVTFTVAATGSPAPTYQWRKDGVNVAGATGASLALGTVQPADAGTYTVVVTNSAGAVTSNGALLTVTGGTGPAPVIVSQPLGFTAAAGGTAVLTVVATGTGLTYQWRKDGVPIPNANQATLTLPAIGAAQAGTYSVVITSGGSAVTSANAVVAVTAGESRLANLSVRANLDVDQTLFVGFALNGAKSVLLRGIGPSLTAFGVGGAHGDPRLEVFTGETKVNENEDWNAALGGTFSAVGAFPLVTGSKDAALQTTVTGSRTAQVKGPGAGVVLVEVYDAGSGNAARLVNVSARNRVGIGDNILIAGFVIGGSVAKTLLIRAIGPTLADFGVGGVLTNPKLEIFNTSTATPVKIVENDDWSGGLANVFDSVGAFGLTPGSSDSALLVTLPPGAYSAQVAGVAGGTGEALVEVYELP